MDPLSRMYLVPAALGLLVLGGCDAATTLPSTDPLVQRIVAMGFARESIVDRGDYFLVEGDITFDKRRLRGAPVRPSREISRPGERPHLQRVYTARVEDSRAANIRVDLSRIYAEDGNWGVAAEIAMQHWTRVLGATVSLTTGGPADITVYPASDAELGGYYADAAFPQNGVPGPTIRVNRKYNGFSLEQKLHVMTHEFGHTLGLTHTNQHDFGIHVPDTPGSDGASVMNTGVTPSPSWSRMTIYDERALIWLYPDRASVSVTQQGDHPFLSWGGLSDASSYDVILVVHSTTEDYNGSSSETREYVSGTTTATSWLDTINPYTGQTYCSYASGWTATTEYYYYMVRTRFPSGATDGHYVPAPVGNC